jgi:hypothetical protein
MYTLSASRLHLTRQGPSASAAVRREQWEKCVSRGDWQLRYPRHLLFDPPSPLLVPPVDIPIYAANFMYSQGRGGFLVRGCGCCAGEIQGKGWPSEDSATKSEWWFLCIRIESHLMITSCHKFYAVLHSFLFLHLHDRMRGKDAEKLDISQVVPGRPKIPF